MSLRYDANGNLIDGVLLMGSNVPDGQTLWTPGMLFNETTSDKPRGNTQGTLLASAARTASTQSANMRNYNAKGIQVFLNVSVYGGTGNLTVFIYGISPVDGSLVTLNVGAPAISATGIYTYEVYPGSTTAGGAGSQQISQRVAGVLSPTWAVAVLPSLATSHNYSLGYALIL